MNLDESLRWLKEHGRRYLEPQKEFIRVKNLAHKSYLRFQWPFQLPFLKPWYLRADAFQGDRKRVQKNLQRAWSWTKYPYGWRGKSRSEIDTLNKSRDEACDEFYGWSSRRDRYRRPKLTNTPVPTRKVPTK